MNFSRIISPATLMQKCLQENETPPPANKIPSDVYQTEQSFSSGLFMAVKHGMFTSQMFTMNFVGSLVIFQTPDETSFFSWAFA